MTGKSTAAQQPGSVFVDSNGRTYPSDKSSCVDASRKSTLRNDTATFTTNISNDNSHTRQSLESPPPPTTAQHINEHALDARGLGNHGGIMDREEVEAEHAQPLVESSKMGRLRVKGGRRPSVAGNRSPSVATGHPTAVKRADSRISNTSEPSSLVANDIGSSPGGLVTVHNEVASMHSDQRFDLGYKSRPAPPYVNRGHMRVWNSAYTRPLEDMLREILDVRYPLDAEDGGENERSSLLELGLRRSNYGWSCGLGSLWWVRARRDGEDDEA